MVAEVLAEEAATSGDAARGLETAVRRQQEAELAFWDAIYGLQAL